MSENRRGLQPSGAGVIDGSEENASGSHQELLETDRKERESSPTSSSSDRKIGGIVIGTLMGFDRASGKPLVCCAAGDSVRARVAATTVELLRTAAGRQVALAFEDGDPERPIVLGVIATAQETERAGQASGGNTAGSLTLSIDGETIDLTAAKELVLRCGKASITLTRAGKILIRGEYLLSRSTGANRIKGGSVQIN